MTVKPRKKATKLEVAVDNALVETEDRIARKVLGNPSSPALAKMQQTRSYLNSVLLDMHMPITLLLTAVIAKKHCVLIGLPGTAKSYLCRLFSECIADAKRFEIQLDESIPKSQVFGSTVKSLISKNEEEHDIDGSLADCDFAVVHEIFKANPVLLNSLLSITEDDRIFYNNKQALATPLWSLFGSSNELPEPGDNEGDFESPLLDRLFIRVEVQDAEGIACFNIAKAGTATMRQSRPELTMDDIRSAHIEANQVTISDDILSLLAYDLQGNRNSLREKMQDDGYRISLRRQLQLWGADGVAVLKAHAYLNGRSEVCEEDFEILPHCLCRTFDQKSAIYKIVRSLKNPDDLLADEISKTAKNILGELFDGKNFSSAADKNNFAEAAPSAQRKLMGMIQELEQRPNKRSKMRSSLILCKKLYNQIGEKMNELFPKMLSLDDFADSDY